MLRRAAIIAAALLLLALAGGQDAQADPAPGYTPPTADPLRAGPILEGVEGVARRYWRERGVFRLDRVEVFRVDNLAGANGFGEEPGGRVWLAAYLLEDLTRGDRRDREDARAWLCYVYVHERGHNGGQSHAAGWNVMHTAKIPTLCARWAARWPWPNV